MRKILSLVMFFYLLSGQEVVSSNIDALLGLSDKSDDYRYLKYGTEESSGKKMEIKFSDANNIHKPHKSVVYILAENTLKNEKSSGAGVVINEQGDILTANHIIKDKTKISILYYLDGDEERLVKDIRKRLVSAQPIKTSEVKDLALLSVDNHKQEHISIVLGFNPSVKQGLEVESFGHPDDWLFAYSRGVIQKVINKYNHHPELPKFNANSILVGFDGAPGDSGSPLLNSKGEMIGLILSNHLHLKFVLTIRVDEIKKFIHE